ncbi:hypothetical protein AURDEDRAFT_151531 [Auricularia subglabra TFB-10046 SS5]|nr:hypothetical protein AURDEDRAFT_151531 [Auricularia subglabra TFB-10046 SS5]
MASSGNAVVVEDDDTAQVAYYPAGAWGFRTGGPNSTYHGKSYHLTSAPGAYLTFTFTGSFVAYYSDLNHDHGDFTVSLDESTVFFGTSYSPSLVEQRVLFSTAVSPGRHILTITNSQNATTTGVDYFSYQPVSLPTLPNTAPATRKKAASTALIAGLASACALVVLLTALTVVLFIRARRRPRSEHVTALPPPYDSENNAGAAGPRAESPDRAIQAGPIVADTRREKLRGH